MSCVICLTRASIIICDCNVLCCRTCYNQYLTYSTHCYNCDIMWDMIDIYMILTLDEFNIFLTNQIENLLECVMNTSRQYTKIHTLIDIISYTLQLTDLRSSYERLVKSNIIHLPLLHTVNSELEHNMTQVDRLFPSAIDLYCKALSNTLAVQELMQYMNHDNSKYVSICPCSGLIDEDYTCNKCNVAHVTIDEYAKPCPCCLIPIYKSEGCNDMYCLVCNTPFNWNTLVIIEGDYHNPHMYDVISNNDYRLDIEHHVYNNIDDHYLTILRYLRILNGFDRQPPIEMLSKIYISHKLLQRINHEVFSHRILTFRLLDKRFNLSSGYIRSHDYATYASMLKHIIYTLDDK